MLGDKAWIQLCNVNALSLIPSQRAFLWIIEKFQYFLTYWEEPRVEENWNLRWDLVSEANIIFNIKHLNEG